MQYNRSGTTMDKVSRFFPQSFLSGLGNATGEDDGGVMSLFTDWAKSAPTMLKDLYIAHQTGEAQNKLLEVNIERARAGLSPISGESVAPRVNVGVARDTMTSAGMIAGGVAAAVLLGLLLSRK